MATARTTCSWLGDQWCLEAGDRTSCRGRDFARWAGLPAEGGASLRSDTVPRNKRPVGGTTSGAGTCSRADPRSGRAVGGALCGALPTSVSGGYVMWAGPRSMGGACLCALAESRIGLRFVGGALLGGRNRDLGEEV